jgi:SpoVK/Ycf46/Vps4 family AAA+-type ATPase
VFLKAILEKSTVIKLGDKIYEFSCMQDKKVKDQLVMAENKLIGTSIFLYKKFIPIIVNVDANYETPTLSVTTMRGLFSVESYSEAIIKKCKNRINEFTLCTRWGIIDKWGSMSTTAIQGKRNFDNSTKEVEATKSTKIDILSTAYLYYHYGLTKLINCEKIEDIGFCEKSLFKNKYRYESKEEKILKSNIKFWLENKDWYTDRQIPWKRGCILYGSPGTGKSSMVWAISKDLDLPIEVLHLETFTNEDLFRKWNSADNGKIVLIEDFDTIFNKRENIACKNLNNIVPLTFDAILNTLDGVSRETGTFVIITTNYPEKIDDALAHYDSEKDELIINRPGRIDIAIKCEPLDHTGALYIAKNILSDLDENEMLSFLNNFTYPITAACVQENCIKKALENKWEKIKGKNLYEKD